MKEAVALHGKLVFLALIFHLIQPYLPSISNFSTSFHDPQAKLHPPKTLWKDLEWVRFLLQTLPNTMPLSPSILLNPDWWGDASTSFGIGIVIGTHWAGWR